MVRSVTFEIRWHDTQPIYSCSFQPISQSHLKRVLDHNLGQAAGLAPGKTLAGPSGSSGSSGSTAISSGAGGTIATKQIQPPIMAGGQSWRLATAGGDNNARLWMVHPNIPSPAALASAAATSGTTAVAPHPPRVEYLATLSRHSGVVNVVRFCPRGEMLATAGDDGNVLFWVPSDRGRGFGDLHSNLDDGESQFEKEFWRVKLMTRATQQELYDMAWSPNGETLAVGGTDFVARIINVQDGHVIREISEHSHYVQGIAWDPLQEYIATQSSDRSVHVHYLQLKHKHDQGEASGSGSTAALSGSHLASRSSKLDLHRRNGSTSGGFIWDSNAKPPMKRRASSHASQASDSEGPRESFVAGLRGRSKRSATPIDPTHHSVVPRASTPSQVAGPSQLSGSSAQPATPTASVPPSPFSATAPGGSHVHAMNPPQMTPSRRSSFSGSNMDVASPPTSATSLAQTSMAGSHVGKTADPAHHAGAGVATPGDGVRRTGSTSRSASRTRSVRSPSPIPPLPAIRAPPSPKQRMQAAVAATTGLSKSTLRLYGDENFSGFFRRLAFSPDGALLVTPSGLFDPPPPPSLASPSVHLSPRKSPSPSLPLSKDGGAAAAADAAATTNKSAVYLYARGNFNKSNAPIAVLPGHKTATLVVRFSPILYELRKSPRAQDGASEDDGIPPHPTIPLEVGKLKSVSLVSEGFNPSSTSVDPPTGSDGTKKASSSARRGPSVIGLPYRMVYAVATQDSVWIYDTQQTGPICCFSNMHYASFTDLSWSPDGQTLMMSSTDGYCSVVVFDYAELGIPYAYNSQPSLQVPSGGTPAPAHIASGTPTRSAPSTPQLANASLAGEATSSSGVAPWLAGTPPPPPTLPTSSSSSASASAPTGLGLALGAAGSGKAGATLAGLPAAVRAAASSPALSSPDATPLSSATAAANVTNTTTASSNTNAGANAAATQGGEAPKKKRRIAPTLQGPLGQ
ncbi:uncharacterized protein PFL1_01674 [Pseudozyma flocculosa PF-1]|uniref:Related to CAC2 - component of the chromatin assembly complex n=1 Tax=Pseudozyma flocculosa TaxID=84751 RepID=A0A5C3EXA9_9BASI|nr:uncharacterized protein PFL1_01674 [Pseudozyma flocculosa PF-1]EPQ30773.1 hypothetical protein PFL1_01674 [Pseudozyma flocculosa PF-1]SPO36864.1 related to CAC2 - component of the chromatin assembly complex [Pseudozyma flocculosa]